MGLDPTVTEDAYQPKPQITNAIPITAPPSTIPNLLPLASLKRGPPHDGQNRKLSLHSDAHEGQFIKSSTGIRAKACDAQVLPLQLVLIPVKAQRSFSRRHDTPDPG